MSQVPTDLVTVLSSTHGRKRRKQRNISKRDLQAAVKHGLKEPANAGPDGQPRWKYTYKNVVYITDASSRKEVTSWPLLKTNIKTTIRKLPRVSPTEHNLQLQIVKSSDTKVSSHTVVVVDMSGSMRKRDVGGSTRAQAVYETLAENLVRKQLKNGGSNLSMLDVVTLIEMRDEAQLVFEAAPLNENLHDTLVSRWSISRPRSHGNYAPSLQLASQLLGKFSHGSCALCLLFLSDGKPSDHGPNGGRPKIMAQVSAMSKTYGRRLVFGTIGFADEKEDFTVLKTMADTAKDFSVGMYQHAKEDLGTAVTSLVTSFTSTKLEMTSADGLSHRTIRAMTREQPSQSSSVSGKWLPGDVWFYRDAVRFRWSEELDDWEEVHMSHPKSNSLVIRRSIFGEGAERVVYAMREARIAEDLRVTPADPCQELLGEHMVAKESRFLEDMCDQAGGMNAMKDKMVRRFQLSATCFHKNFCRTQQIAQGMAEQFNRELQRQLPPDARLQVPQVRFLECFVYLIWERTSGGDQDFREVLAEKRLDVDKYKKWNSNAGYVAGQKRARKGACWGAIPEEEEERNVQAGSGVTVMMEEEEVVGGKRTRSEGERVEHEDIPQAFSHFSWQRSERSPGALGGCAMLVCDLQGVYSEAATRAPVFELTDPVIHHATTAGAPKQHAFGRTDKGMQGIRDFFATHACNGVCRLLQLDPAADVRARLQLMPSNS